MNFLESMTSLKNPQQLLASDPNNFKFLHFHTYLKDLKGRYLNCNPNMVKDLGLNGEDDLLGLNDFDLSFLPESEASILRNHDRHVIAMDKTQFFIEHCTLHNGKKAIAFSQKSALKNRANKIIGSAGFSLIVDEETTSLNMESLNPATDFDVSSKLTLRQTDCVLLLTKGMTIKQIAKTLQLSPKTVEHYIGAIKIKLNCTNRAELILKALKMKVIRDQL